MASKTGLEKVLAKLNKELKTIENKTVGSLVKAAIIIQRDMEFTQPLTPVDLGNLRSSYFITSISQTINPGSFTGPKTSELSSYSSEVISKYEQMSRRKNKGGYSVYFGFTAYYAAKVHEWDTAIFKRPGSGPFFFEASIKRNSARIITLAWQEAKIK